MPPIGTDYDRRVLDGLGTAVRGSAPDPRNGFALHKIFFDDELVAEFGARGDCHFQESMIQQRSSRTIAESNSIADQVRAGQRKIPEIRREAGHRGTA